MAGNMNFEGYIHDLKNALTPNADRIYGGKRWLLQQDNAPYHTSNLSSDFIVANDIALLLLPDSRSKTNWKYLGVIQEKNCSNTINSQSKLAEIVGMFWFHYQIN